MDAIGEVCVFAETSNVRLAASELLGFPEHAGNAVLLHIRVSKSAIDDK